MRKLNTNTHIYAYIETKEERGICIDLNLLTKYILTTKEKRIVLQWKSIADTTLTM